ncbi:hypothetical protein [Cryptosporangium phraense]|uniref:Uncharacterized protein n=1 Tax=Cryptosporangium phraense TaxID=2593070 RepID=A0A545AES2_9ACTN|nr:hypothetical protein [Cryptosporangium phraense]TQS39831.1 hypothetical protein FL583_38080 [Cryptosporangium phraense]
MTSGVLYELHIAPKDGEDVSLRIPDASDAEIPALLAELERLAEEFIAYLGNEIVPTLEREPFAGGLIEHVTLLRGNVTTTSTDFLLFLDGLVDGDGAHGDHPGVIARIAEKFSVRATLRHAFTEVGSWPSPAAG